MDLTISNNINNPININNVISIGNRSKNVDKTGSFGQNTAQNASILTISDNALNQAKIEETQEKDIKFLESDDGALHIINKHIQQLNQLQANIASEYNDQTSDIKSLIDKTQEKISASITGQASSSLSMQANTNQYKAFQLLAS